MPFNLITIKAFLGKYYPELAVSALQDKYLKTGLSKFFEQRFNIQNNKTRMIIDPSLKGLIAIVSGNELIVSQQLHEHEYIDITNSMETGTDQADPKSLYNSDTFSSVAYLICQNHTMFNIVGETDEPIYIRYTSEYETFYNSVIIVNIAEGIEAEVIEEFESKCALNTVANYVVHPHGMLHLTTFYNNNVSALSFCLRNVIIQESANFTHVIFGRGSSNSLDESKIYANNGSDVVLLACVDPGNHEFHAIINILPVSQDYKLLLDHRHIVSGSGKATFTPIVAGNLPVDAYTNIGTMVLEDDDIGDTVKILDFVGPITDRAVLTRTVGVERFYHNKSKFFLFQ